MMGGRQEGRNIRKYEQRRWKIEGKNRMKKIMKKKHKKEWVMEEKKQGEDEREFCNEKVVIL